MKQYQQQPEPLITIQYRLTNLEQDLDQLKKQLGLYVPARENDLQLQSIRSTVERIEKDLSSFKEQMTKWKEDQDKLLVRILWGAISIIISFLVAVLIGYVTHFF